MKLYLIPNPNHRITGEIMDLATKHSNGSWEVWGSVHVDMIRGPDERSPGRQAYKILREGEIVEVELLFSVE